MRSLLALHCTLTPVTVRLFLMNLSCVMPAASRFKNGVASLAYVAGIHVVGTAAKTRLAGTSPAMTAER
jgi:hypothetical protein